MRNRFGLVLLSITLYWFLMDLMGLSGVTPTKIMITLLLWFSFCLIFIYFIGHYRIISSKVPAFAFAIFIVLVLLNFINILRGGLGEGEILTTTMGNPYNSIALLTPFAMVLGLNKVLLAIINRFFIYSTAIGLALYIFIIATSFGSVNTYLSSAIVLLSSSTFLIGTIAYQNRTNKVIIYIGTLLLFGYVGVLVGSRATFLRICSLYLSNMAVSFYGKVKTRWFLAIAMCILMLPFLMIWGSLDRGESAFEIASQYLQSNFGGKSSQALIVNKGDTRTFLYQEVFRDLVRNGRLLLGKGSNGRYYSPFFNQTKGDSDTRLTVEVGILAYLLKGGIVAVILNLVLLFLAIFFAFFKSKSQYVRWVGFMLLFHTLILFVENLVSYDMYNFSVWFFVGVCLSKDIRVMSNQEIQAVFHRRPKLFPIVY